MSNTDKYSALNPRSLVRYWQQTIQLMPPGDYLGMRLARSELTRCIELAERFEQQHTCHDDTTLDIFEMGCAACSRRVP